MKTLEEILQEFGCNGEAFDNKGELTDTGMKAYKCVEHFLIDIEILTGVSVAPIIRQLDEISSTNYC